MRQLKYHEQKLLKKVNFLRWKNEHNLRELQVRTTCRSAALPKCSSYVASEQQPLQCSGIGRRQSAPTPQTAFSIAVVSSLIPILQLGLTVRAWLAIHLLQLCNHSNLILSSQVMRRYHIQDRDDYVKYNKICGMITQLTNVLKQLDPQDKTRIELTDRLLNK